MESEKLYNVFRISVTGYYEGWDAKQIYDAKKALLLALTGKDEADAHRIRVDIEAYKGEAII